MTNNEFIYVKYKSGKASGSIDDVYVQPVFVFRVGSETRTVSVHPAGNSVNFAFCSGINKFCFNILCCSNVSKCEFQTICHIASTSDCVLLILA